MLVKLLRRFGMETVAGRLKGTIQALSCKWDLLPLYLLRLEWDVDIAKATK